MSFNSIAINAYYNLPNIHADEYSHCDEKSLDMDEVLHTLCRAGAR